MINLFVEFKKDYVDYRQIKYPKGLKVKLNRIIFGIDDLIIDCATLDSEPKNHIIRFDNPDEFNDFVIYGDNN